MKKNNRVKVVITLISMLFATLLTTFAADYTISFNCIGASSTLETVQVKNLTKGTNITLSGSESLHLTGSTGITIANMNNKPLRIYPNPMTTNTNIEFEVLKAGEVTVNLFDITGKKVCSIQNNLPTGVQTIRLIGLNSGVYTLSIKSDINTYSGKIVSISKVAGVPTINYTTIGETSVDYTTRSFRSAQTSVDMPYNDGDRIQLKAISGNYSTIKTFVPIASSTETFNFVAATDADGNNYSTVTIGTQTWMVENLKTTKYNDGTDIPLVITNATWGTLTSPAYSWYNNDATTYKDTYGGMYNQHVVNTGKLAPVGWHVPTDAEWTTLVTYLGGGAIAGSKLKEKGNIHWTSLNTDATNESGFSALPGGNRYSNGMFSTIGLGGSWWGYPGAVSMNCNSSTVSFSSSNSKFGFSIRCVKD